MEKKKTDQIAEVVLIILALLFIFIGCERELTKSTELTESSEQTQSLNETAPATVETVELGVIIERNVPVPMRDGTILRADVHRPDRGGPYPVLVRRTQYSKSGNHSWFVKAGYIVVDQDVRGRYKSDGEFEPYRVVKIHDAQDGYDTVEWAAKLPGSNGKVGTFGYSDPGMRQWPAAALRPPSLKAMHANRCYVRLTDVTKGTVKPFSIRSVLPLETRRRNNHPGVHTKWEAEKLWAEEEEKWTWWLPWSELPRDIFDDEIEEIEYLVENPNFDPLKLDNYCKDIVVPNLAIYGWFDVTSGDILLFQKMVKEAKSEVARRSSQLIIGPWTHSTFGRRIGSIDFGPRAGIDRVTMQIRWFDHWLKGSQNGVGKNSPVRIFVMGDNQWRDEESWPLARSKEKVFYMTSDGRANTPAGSGCLTETSVIESGTDRYEYDPSDPVLSPSGPLRNDGLFPSDQRRLAQRQDILVYQTEPLKERMEATGEPVVDLYAASSARDTDWFVRLIDVHPDGPAVDVSHGFLRARYRNGLDRPEFIKPGEVIKYVIPMRPTSNAFLPGHRIRLDITSSYFPGRDRNHNTAEDQYADATLVTAYQAIHHGGERATRITLPWVANPIKPAELVEEARPEPAKETKPKPVKEAKSEPVAEPEEQAYPLHQAATDGDIEQVKHLVSEGANINALGKEKDTPLCRAVKARQMETVRLLVEADADVNAGSPPPLYIAVDVNDITIAKHLITHGAQVNPLKKWILFKHIPSSSSTEMAQLFIDNGADINSGPWTVWHGAIEENRADIMRILLQNGMDINTVGLEGKTPLELALSWRKEDMAAFLLANGADIHRKLKNGLTLWFNAAVEGHTWIAELLLARGVNIDERDDVYEFTALHYAARFGQKEIAELLIQKGADIEAKDKWDYQPIHWAAYHNRPDVIELLIAKGADVNAKTSLDQTPLQLAEPRRNTAAIEVLRKHGAKE